MTRTKTSKVTKSTMDTRLARALGLSGFVIFVIVVNFVTPRAASRSEVADAAARGDITAVRALIAQKDDVNAPQADGATALHWAGVVEAFRGNLKRGRGLVEEAVATARALGDRQLLEIRR